MHLKDILKRFFLSAGPVLFLFNFFAGVLFLNEGLFHHDSVVLAQAVEQAYQTGHLQPSIRGRYGAVIINSLLYLPFFLLGLNADLMLRLSSVLFHALSVCMLFYFVKAFLENETKAFFAAFLFSFIPVYFIPNTYGKEHGMSMFFLLLSFYLVYCGSKKGNLLFLSLSGFFFIFSITVRESMLITASLYVLLYFGTSGWISLQKEKVSKARLIAWCIPFAISFLTVYCTYLKREFYQAIYVGDFSDTQFLGLLSSVLPRALADIYTSVPTMLLVFFIIGADILLRQQKAFQALCLLLWSLLIFYLGNVISYCPRYLDLVFVPICILAAESLYAIYAQEKLLCYGILIYFVMALFNFMYPLLSFRHIYNGEKQFALYVREKTPENSIVVAIDDAPFMEYYGHRATSVIPVNAPESMEKFMKQLKDSMKRGIPVYMMESAFYMMEAAFIYDSKYEFTKKFFTEFSVNVVGEKLSEDYHRPELSLNTYMQKLFKLELKREGQQ